MLAFRRAVDSQWERIEASMKKTERAPRKPRVLFLDKSLTQQQLARWCAIVFLLSLLPLIAIALYNYPADDDFGFTLPAATAWVNTHSLGVVFQAIVDKTIETYMTWQGDFTSTFLFSLNPLVFNIKLYFLANWYLLALLCLSVGYLLKGFTTHWLKAPRSVFWIAYTAIMILVLQFMPSIAESVYWYNGGQYTVAVCFLMLSLGLLLRCGQWQSRGRGIIRGVLLAICGVVLGGSFFGPALGAFVILSLIALTGFITKAKYRWHSLVALVFFCAAFAISVIAPGNVLRQERTGESLGMVSAILTSVLDSFDLTGKWLFPQLFAMLMLILPVMWKPLKESGFSFRHPLWMVLMFYAMFAASLTPGVYTGFGYTTGRYLNAIYLYYLIMIIGSAIYVEGAFIRWLESRQESDAPKHLLLAGEHFGTRFGCIYLALCIALLTLGGFANTIMNTPSISATKSLITGEAAQFSREMAERQEYIRVTDSDVVAVKTLSVIVPVFKPDKLPFQGIYGRVRYMKWYFELFYNSQQK